MILSSSARRSVTRRSAFTLLEVLVVMAIIVILATVAGVSIFRYLEEAKVTRAEADLQALDRASKAFYAKHFVWPDYGNQEHTALMVSFLETGDKSLNSPWPNVQYSWETVTVVQPDGTEITRLQFYCQPPGKPPILYPDPNKR